MSRLTKRMLASVGAVALLASIMSLTGSASAAPRVGDDEVPIQLLDAPPATAESSGPLTSPASPGTGATERGIAPEATVVSDGTFEGQPAHGESVIGTDGRVQVTDTTVYPARAIGQIEFFQANGGEPGNFICTGWLTTTRSSPPVTASSTRPSPSAASAAV